MLGAVYHDWRQVLNILRHDAWLRYFWDSIWGIPFLTQKFRSCSKKSSYCVRKAKSKSCCLPPIAKGTQSRKPQEGDIGDHSLSNRPWRLQRCRRRLQWHDPLSRLPPMFHMKCLLHDLQHKSLDCHELQP